MTLKEEIDEVIKQVGNLQTSANTKGINLDFERVLIMLETMSTSAGIAEGVDNVRQG